MLSFQRCKFKNLSHIRLFISAKRLFLVAFCTQNPGKAREAGGGLETFWSGLRGALTLTVKDLYDLPLF